MFSKHVHIFRLARMLVKFQGLLAGQEDLAHNIFTCVLKTKTFSEYTAWKFSKNLMEDENRVAPINTVSSQHARNFRVTVHNTD